MKITLTIPELIINIKNTYNLATYEDNMYFYEDANIFCTLLSIKHNIDVVKLAGIVSALSPGCNWEQNKKDTIELLSGKIKGFSTYPVQSEKALQIYRLVNCTVENVYTIIYGKGAIKTGNFFLNILLKSTVVTIDRHAAKIALNITAGGSIPLTIKQYNLIQSAYIIAASDLQINPIHLQAVTWTTYKRVNNR